MRTNQTFSISFFIRKKRQDPELALLFVRITVNGRGLEMSLKRTVETARWDKKGQRVLGTNPEAQAISRKISDTRAMLYAAFDSLRAEESLVTAQSVKSRFLGTDRKNRTLTELLEYHNGKMQRVLKMGTLKNYYTTDRYLRDFLDKKGYGRDIYLKQIDYAFVLDFEEFVRNKPKIHNNGVMKHMERFKKLLRLARDIEWMEKDPSARFKLRLDKVDMVYLNEEELELIKNVNLETENLRITRDMFLFACNTGLAYSDIRKLQPRDIQIGIDGQRWIVTKRLKTDTQLRIPMLKNAREILASYREHPKAMINQKLLPVYSNQKTNAYLKQIAKKAGINKKITFHTARHTFATTVTLSNGVPIETVSKLLGHQKMSTTLIYARVIDTKISQDMYNLDKKLNSKTT